MNLHRGKVSVGSTVSCKISIAVALLISLFSLQSCNRQTEDPKSDVVRLRDNLKALAAGDLQDVKGRIPTAEGYVLLYGYQGSLESLPISETLRASLNRLIPYDYERYVLAHFAGDEIVEYTVWEAGDDPQFKRVPILIRGDPYRLVVEQREDNLVVVRLE
jgi:hypothetical protein